MILRFFCLLLFFSLSLCAVQNQPAEKNRSGETVATQEGNQTEEEAREAQRKKETEERLSGLKARILQIDLRLEQENIWVKKYSNYQTYKNIETELLTIDNELKKLKLYKRTSRRAARIEELEKNRRPLAEQLILLEEFKENPYKDLIQPGELSSVPTVDNPFEILRAFSYIKQAEQMQLDYENIFNQLQELLAALTEKKEIFSEMLEIIKHKESIATVKQEIAVIDTMMEEFSGVETIFNTTRSVFSKKIEQIKIDLNGRIQNQGEKAALIFSVLIGLILFSLFIKYVLGKYISDNERLYMANKFVNFGIYSLVILILLFAYLENVSHLVTVLGFASAGLAIALKDWFMSIMGWVVIVFGGSIHVGDRLKIMKDGAVYVGDVLGISLLKITIHEDITLTSYMENRRTGRIIFIPNNFIFTHLISNYSHMTMKTVWDGIDITITFDSNYKKAIYLSREIAKKYSKGYSDITRKQLNKLRDRYILRNTNVEPRSFHFIEPNGMRISTWYLTNCFATLTLRSTICGEIVEAFSKEDDIQIAYPTTTVRAHQPTTPFDGQVPPDGSGGTQVVDLGKA